MSSKFERGAISQPFFSMTMACYMTVLQRSRYFDFIDIPNQL